MKKLTKFLLILLILNLSCKSKESMLLIQPKSGSIDLPINGEFRVWDKIKHPSFSVTLFNTSSSQSCEVYKVNENGFEKWITPSLKAGQTLKLTIPANGHLFIKNFNNNLLKINYKVEE